MRPARQGYVRPSTAYDFFATRGPLIPVTVTNSRLTQTMSNARGGRRSKGQRELLGTRAPVLLAEAARTKAAELGLNVNDYLATLIAQDTNMLEFAPRPADPTRLELPITAA
ncbi:hypothetical protein LLS1_37520 [Leifsonia sp. LS1]|nr:hypothetical protein LLS1_37520 [Leifsonia sp. LS1]